MSLLHPSTKKKKKKRNRKRKRKKETENKKNVESFFLIRFTATQNFWSQYVLVMYVFIYLNVCDFSSFVKLIALSNFDISAISFCNFCTLLATRPIDTCVAFILFFKHCYYFLQGTLTLSVLDIKNLLMPCHMRDNCFGYH